MGKENSKPTIIDVANLAGVSVGTVSKVINGKSVGESYEKKVKIAIKALNYKVNSYAQGLKASKTYTVVVIIPNTYHSFFGDGQISGNLNTRCRNAHTAAHFVRK